MEWDSGLKLMAVILELNMNNNKILNKILVVILTLCMAVSFAGCSGVDLTEEESQKIAEYSAGLLLKYSKGYKGNLTNAQYVPPVDPVTIESDEAIVPEEEEVLPEVTEDDANGEGQKSDNKSNSDSYFEGGFSEAIGLDGFDVNFSGVEFVDKFPNDDVEDLVFSMQAQPGNKLITLHFNVININDTPALCDMLHNNVKFRMKINNHDVINAQSTILLNDFKQYYEEIAGNSAADCVLIFEASEETCQSIQNADLVTVKEGEKKKLKLF